MRRRGRARLVVLVLLVSVAGCASRHAGPGAGLSCSARSQQYLRAAVYLDRSNTKDPLRPYSEEEWDRFIQDVLVRLLPDGGSVFDNTGWWRRPNGTTFRGIGRTLVVLAPESQAQAHRAGVKSVIDAIKQRYGHQLVIWEEARVCAVF